MSSNKIDSGEKMSSEIEWTKESGDNKTWKVRVYALSTCGFCHRAMEFLKDHSIDFEYVYVDQLDRETIRQVRDGFREKFNLPKISYPILSVDEEKYIIGFKEDEYKELFNIK